MGSLETISWELVGVIITLIIGFAGVMYTIGRRDSEISALKEGLVSLGQGLHDHEEECKDRYKEAQSEKKEVNARLAEGSKQLALLNAGQERMEKDIAEIKEAVKK